MRILVTGGAGYIGSVVAVELLATGHTVVIYDNLSHGYRATVPRCAELVVGDTADRAKLDDVFARYRIDAVMHFAALIEAGESMKYPERFFRNNTANTLTLLEAMVHHGVKRIVFSSTAAVYGEPPSAPIRETDPLQPTNVYGESKLLVERMLAWFHRIHGLRYASLRYFNAAGATLDLGEAHRPETHLIPLLIQVALGTRDSVSIFGIDYPTRDGTCIRDYIHVSDLAKAHILALEALNTRPQLVYNLGNGRGFTVREVIAATERVAGRRVKTLEATRRAGDPVVLVASSEAIQRELGWRPQYTELESIVETAWDWHRRHPNGYSS